MKKMSAEKSSISHTYLDNFLSEIKSIQARTSNYNQQLEEINDKLFGAEPQTDASLSQELEYAPGFVDIFAHELRELHALLDILEGHITKISKL